MPARKRLTASNQPGRCTVGNAGPLTAALHATLAAPVTLDPAAQLIFALSSPLPMCIDEAAKFTCTSEVSGVTTAWLKCSSRASTNLARHPSFTCAAMCRSDFCRSNLAEEQDLASRRASGALADRSFVGQITQLKKRLGQTQVSKGLVSSAKMAFNPSR